MALKINVEDRVPTYPGRVKLTPVQGEANTYDMVRADLPLNPGTPVNKVLFDSKADRVTEDVTVYVSSGGNDVTGTGDVSYPFKTIQAAIDAIPKNLDGHTVTIQMDQAVYTEHIVCRGFSGGKLVIGIPSVRSSIEGGVEIDNCSVVELNLSTISKGDATTGAALLNVTNGSIVIVPYDLVVNASGENFSGVQASYGSVISFGYNYTLTVHNCNSGAVVATSSGRISLSTVRGNGNMLGLVATMGGTITHGNATYLNSDFGENEQDGGRIFTN